MRVLIVNPNTSPAVTRLIEAAARTVAAPGTEIVAKTATRGVPYIATLAEAVIGGAVALEMLAEQHHGFDVAIIGAFGDPGLAGARGLLPIPVVGIAEAAMLTACMLGRRFSCIAFADALIPWFRECVSDNGLSARCSSIRAIEGGFTSVDTVQREAEARLAELANHAVIQDQADVVVVAGGPLAGLAPRLSERVPVPLVDPVMAAVKQAEALVALRPRRPLAGSFRPGAPKPSEGLSEAVATLLTGGTV